MSIQFKSWLLLFCVSAAFLYCGLGDKPMDREQEVRVAETARVMVASGDWLLPRYNDALRLRKPPLAYWLTASSYRLFATVNEFAARFASATFALLTVLLLFCWGSKTLGTRTAMIAALAFISSFIALRYFRSSETDGILLFFVVSACILAFEILHAGPSLRRVLLLHLCMGLGFLSKGPAAIAIPLLLLLVYTVKQRQLNLWKQLLHPLGLLLLLLTAFGWYATILYLYPEAARAGLFADVDATYINGTHAGPVYWYLQRMLLLFLPWGVFIIPAAIWLYKNRPHPPVIHFALIWFVLSFTLLSLNSSKQVQYALLLNPPLMLLLGYYLSVSGDRFAKANRIFFLILYALGVGVLGYALFKWASVDADGRIQLALLVVIGGLPLLLGRLLAAGQALPQRELLLAGMMVSLWIFGQHYLYSDPAFDGQQIKELTRTARAYQPLYVYATPNPRVSFYAGRVVLPVQGKAQISRLLNDAGTFYLLVPSLHPEWNSWGSGTEISMIKTSKDFSLWKITAPTTAPAQ